MTLGPLLLLLSAFFHAAWNALAKSSKHKEGLLFISIVVGIVFCFFAAWITEDLRLPSSRAVALAMGSGVFEGLYLFALAKTLKNSALGSSYAIMRGGAMILVWIVSVAFFGETASLQQSWGAVLVLFGILVMNSQHLKLRGLIKENAWALVSAVMIAGYHSFYHQALDSHAPPLTLFTVSAAVSLPFFFISLGKTRIEKIRATVAFELKRSLLTGALCTMSFVIFLYGLQVSMPGIAISLRNSSIFFALIFSYFLKESLHRSQIVGAIVIGVGTIFLSF